MNDYKILHAAIVLITFIGIVNFIVDMIGWYHGK